MHLLVEKSYIGNLRLARLFEGMKSVLRRGDSLKIWTDPSEVPTDARPAIIVPLSSSWGEEMVAELSRRGLFPLVFGFRYFDLPYRHAAVAPDYTGSAYRLARKMLSDGGRVAILGYNDDSMPDRLKYVGIKRAANEAGAEYKIFKNHGNVTACLESFISEADEFSVAIACNDNVAVALTSKYKSVAQNLKICSCSGSKISEFSKNPYPVLKINYFSAGALLARFAHLIAADTTGGVSEVTFLMEECGDILTKELLVRDQSEKIDFYGDGGLVRMERLNRMLEFADERDLSILAHLTLGDSYEVIAEKNYVSVGTVKYRMKKLQSHAGVLSARELVELMEEFSVTDGLARRAFFGTV